MAKLTQEQVIENLVAGFKEDLQAIVTKARRGTIEYLTSRLSIVDGVISKNKNNQRVLRGIAARFQREMNRAGYRDLVDTFVESFNGQFVFFDDVLKKLGEGIGKDLTVKFGPRDEGLFASQQISSVHVLEDVLVTVAADAQRQALLSVGGLKLSDLISEIATQFDKSIPEATGIADTAMSIHQRLIADRGYKIVERTLPAGVEMRYKYLGPLDRVTRPFCVVMCEKTEAGVTWTRAEIDAMDNGQGMPVWTSCGGHRCRHGLFPVAFKQ